MYYNHLNFNFSFFRKGRSIKKIILTENMQYKVHTDVFEGIKNRIQARGPGALCRVQEYHCNLALFFFSARKVHKLM